MENLITSQHYIDDTIVAAKIEAGDFEVQVSPEFEIDGQVYRVVLDGHHSLAAALLAGETPDYIEQTAEENDKVALIGTSVEDFLAACWMDGEYQFAATGKAVW